ncbi:unnamed protein product [Didymodactylos carnosus]|uniref:Uncharacterized protein n=2 Tax=Didymodactylos carnosus TaxID=1234261 RepID=A0A813NIQ1_9BILA|nr:unnamed protein product [Didymodactylos carnosus]CAF3515078.1 unnamed protein product [Didymodactylos carnosus]
MSEEGEYKPKENFENYIKYYYCREYRRTYPGIHQDLHDQIQTWFLQSVEKKSINTKYNTTTTTYFIEENEKCVNEINRFKLMKKSRISDPSRILTNKEEVQMMMSIDVCNIRKFGELTSEKKITSGTASILSTSAEDTVKTQKLTTEMNSVQANLKSIPEAHRGDTSSQKVATHIPKMNHIVYAQGSSSSEARAKLQCEFNRHLLSRTSYSRSSG